MKTNFSLRVALCLSLVLCALARAANLAPNGDCEKPFVTKGENLAVPDGWAATARPVPGGSAILRQDEVARPGSTGKFSQRVEVIGKASYTGMELKRGDLVTGREYMLRYWIKVEGEGAAASVEFSNGKGELLNELYAPGDWRQVVFPFVAQTPNLFLFLRCAAVAEGKSLIYHVDDIELLPIGEVSDYSGPAVEHVPTSGYKHRYAYDLGSRVTRRLDGYQIVNTESAYDAKRGFGFDAVKDMGAGGAVERLRYKENKAVASALSEDWLYRLGDGEVSNTFRIDLPNGWYKVQLYIGDSGAKPATPFFNVYAEDAKVESIVIRRSVGLIADPAFWVQVKDGQLNLRFASDGQINPLVGKQGWLVNGIVVYPKADRIAAERQIELDTASLYRLPLDQLAGASVAAREVPSDPYQPNEAEKQRGFVLFTSELTGRGSEDGPLSPDLTPSSSQVVPELSVRLTPGEYEPAVLGIYPTADRDRVSVELDPAGLGGMTLDVRKIRYLAAGNAKQYNYRSGILEPAREFDLTNGRTEGLWLTVHAPPEQKPGKYTAAVHIHVDGKRVATMPVSVEVLPFQLQIPPQVVWGMYYYWNPMFDDEMLRDMREHGIHSVTISSEDKLAEKIEKDQPLELFDTLTKLQALGLSGPFPWHCTEPSNGYVLGYKFDPQNPQLDAATTQLVKKMVQRVVTTVKERKLPEVLFYMADEPNSGFRNAMATQLFKIAKEVPGARTYVTITSAGLKPMKPYIDFRCYAKSDARDILTAKDVTPEGAAFWYYTPSHQLDIGNSRRYAGIVMWGRGMTGYSRWHFYDDPSVLNPLNGMVTQPHYQVYAMVFPMWNGQHAATVGWEACREGIDDYKYLWTLEERLRQAASGSKGQRAKQIETELATLKQAASDSGPPKSAWPAERYRTERDRVIAWILELQ